MPSPLSASLAGQPRRHDHADPLGREAASLRRHLQHCGHESGRWSGLAGLASHVNGFFMPRFATTLSVIAAVIVVVSMAV